MSTPPRLPPLPPGATIGILGNGQLGRMLCLAAARLGFRTHVFGPEADSPAEQVSTMSTVASYEDEAALAAFADTADVVTFEFENVPAASAAFLAAHTDVKNSGWRACWRSRRTAVRRRNSSPPSAPIRRPGRR